MTLKRIVVGGEGGQGVQTVAEVLAEGAYASGLEASYMPNFGVEQRGGVSFAFVQIGDEPIIAPKFKGADLAVALSDRAFERLAPYLTPSTLVVVEASAQRNPSSSPHASGGVVLVPAAKIAQAEFEPRAFNIIMLGVLAGLVNMVDEEALKTALERRMGYRFAARPQLRDLYHRALRRGKEMALSLQEGDAGGTV
jgi:2-oxoglutarate ferredoxin oxidoreductase subunit gamma